VVSFADFEKMLNKQDDTIRVYNFWATWCRPCIQELPSFEQLNQNYHDKKVKVVLVSLDFTSQYEKLLIPFVKKNQIKSQVMLLDYADADGWIDKVSEKWSGAIPATKIIDHKSGTDNFYEKQFTYPELENIIKPLLKN
jgi:thiol-disulfide isomerase/thioredoxin